jgi:hypothetical protein
MDRRYFDRPYRRFMILSWPRCGTHMLRTSLGGHRDVVALAEMFNPDWTEDAPFDENTPAEKILNDHVFCDYPEGTRAVGFALHRSGARFGKWPGLWQRLEADESLHVISLRRNNLLRRALSFRIMVEPKTSPPEPKRMSPEQLRLEFERREQELTRFDQRFSEHPLLPVSYEELCTQYETTLGRIQAFLGVPTRPLQPGTTRERPRRLQDAIANFDELAEAFAATRWAWFFDEESSKGK